MVNKTRLAMVSIDWDLVDLIELLGKFEFVGFFDPNKDGDTGEFVNFGSDKVWEEIKRDDPSLKVVLGTDNPALRAKLYTHYGADESLTILSPLAHISPRTSIGHGSVIQHGVKVMPNASVGTCCKLNVNAVVHHHSRVGDFSILGPGALLLGSVTVEANVFVGSGAIIRQGCRVGSGAIIGAGAVVLEDIPANAIVVGVPASRRLD